MQRPSCTDVHAHRDKFSFSVLCLRKNGQLEQKELVRPFFQTLQTFRFVLKSIFGQRRLQAFSLNTRTRTPQQTSNISRLVHLTHLLLTNETHFHPVDVRHTRQEPIVLQHLLTKRLTTENIFTFRRFPIVAVGWSGRRCKGVDYCVSYAWLVSQINPIHQRKESLSLSLCADPNLTTRQEPTKTTSISKVSEAKC